MTVAARLEVVRRGGEILRYHWWAVGPWGLGWEAGVERQNPLPGGRGSARGAAPLRLPAETAGGWRPCAEELPQKDDAAEVGVPDVLDGRCSGRC